MKNLLKNIVKNNRLIYLLYYYIMSILINIIGLFCKMKENQILFVVYGGKRYDDSPRVIYEFMKKNDKYKDMIYKWAFIEPKKFDFIPENEKVKIDTIEYYITALKSKYWLTNSSVERGIKFKKKQTVNILFEHGMAAIKKLGEDLDKSNKSFKTNRSTHFNMIFLEGLRERNLIGKAWNTSTDIMQITGLPRNDELYHLNLEKINAIKKKLGIPEEKKVILYAPTFREYYLDKQFNNIIKNPFNFEKWKKELGDKYVFLFTAHYQIGKLLEIPTNNDFVINAFEYPYINDLLMVADILISDYSSVSFDYSILERPVFCYGFDYDEYKEKRGFYTDPEDIFSHGVIKKEEELLRYIKDIDYEKECKYTKENIKGKYIFDSEGKATETIMDIIFKKEV